MASRLKNQKIVVVGGSSGVGLETALQAKSQGATVTVLGRDLKKLEEASKLGLKTAQVDASNEESIIKYFNTCGKFDHLILTVSGGAGGGLFRSLPLKELRTAFEGKFWPQLYCLQAALKTLRPDGSVTFVSAISSRSLQPGYSGLAALNMALESMVPVLASELRPLRVNCVSPGVIDTPWWDSMPAEAKEALFKGLSAASPVGRIGKPEDVAEAILLLVNNTFITGTVIDVDGGFKLKPL